MPLPESIEKNVLKLKEKDRLHLLLKLLESLDPETENQDQLEQWVNEADSRYRAWEAGEMKTVSEDDVFRELRKKT